MLIRLVVFGFWVVVRISCLKLVCCSMRCSVLSIATATASFSMLKYGIEIWLVIV